MQGTVKKVLDKGFGFIQDDRGQEWFFHRSGCLTTFDTIQPGARVSFEEESSPKGPRATKVRVG